MMETASLLAAEADIFLVVGTSLVVYPAAGLVDVVPLQVPKFIIDPKRPEGYFPGVQFIQQKATAGLREFKSMVDGQ